MLPREVIRQIRRLQIRARRAVDNMVGGEYHSIFKGKGIAFEEVREYQPGDDTRSIDWNVTARMGHAFIKRYIEERELTVVLLVDQSASNQFGTQLHLKHEVIAEIAAVLAFSAICNNDRVSLISFTDRIEKVVPPGKGTRHALRLIRDILFFQPAHPGTSIRNALHYVNRLLRRRAIVFLLSDFHDRDFEQVFKRTARRHDLVAVRVTDRRELELPRAGLVELRDAESGQRFLLNTRRPNVREQYADAARRRRLSLQQLARAAQTDLVELSTDGHHLEALFRFFRLRERRLRKV